MYYRKSMYDYASYRNIIVLNGYSGTELWEIDEILPIQECSNIGAIICIYIDPYSFLGDFDGNARGDVLLIGNYSSPFSLTSLSVQNIQSQDGEIISSEINPRQPVPEEMWRRSEMRKGTAQASGGGQRFNELSSYYSRTFSASNGSAPGGGAGGVGSGGYLVSNNYYARAFRGDNINTIIWTANSSNLVYPVRSWSMYDQEPGIDYNADGFPDAALVVNNTIYMLVRNDSASPVADCGHDKSKCENAGAPVQFDGSASSGAIVSYAWNFGDGTNGTGVTPVHKYSIYKWNGSAYQPFIVNLTVTDNEGMTNSTSINVVIWIAGDANGDGKVNILDASIIGLKWGTADPCADLNNDGKVNIIDASIIGLNWGRKP
jgi:hypothetical protein